MVSLVIQLVVRIAKSLHSLIIKPFDSATHGKFGAKSLYAFLLLAAVVLLTPGLAKAWSAFDGATILMTLDPILGIQIRHLMLTVGVLELIIASICLFGKSQKLKLGLIAWLTTSFVLYRLGLGWMGWQKPCSCMGNLTDALHIPPQTADTVMKIILAYLLIGSYASLFWLWRQKRKASIVAPSPEKATGSAV